MSLMLHSAAPAAERCGGVRAESLLHDGLCDGHRRAAGEGPDRPCGDGSPDGGVIDGVGGDHGHGGREVQWQLDGSEQAGGRWCGDVRLLRGDGLPDSGW